MVESHLDSAGASGKEDNYDHSIGDYKRLLLKELRSLLECCTGSSFGLVFYVVLTEQPIRYFRLCEILRDVLSVGQVHNALKRLREAGLLTCDDDGCWHIKTPGFRWLVHLE